jgi:hypothetical protein
VTWDLLARLCRHAAAYAELRAQGMDHAQAARLAVLAVRSVGVRQVVTESAAPVAWWDRTVGRA